ncbi:hypothetical protein BCR37DRAFT_96780 [Protomyces lactucae-debilis]|uniref:Uncharacterized protein n=1 Tax=Protomyces lactucae-debilis TaxID=2754530 RepID=A0A1Y2F6M0_PROLT|nr:uncharacterized protein BCR37DRAFT_96780 [Protomyces lactucae-debilis]ORY79542.1 hypothetical protein BCR37DRAFT_96780 [Protomyces lactucae-debilis]
MLTGTRIDCVFVGEGNIGIICQVVFHEIDVERTQAVCMLITVVWAFGIAKTLLHGGSYLVTIAPATGCHHPYPGLNGVFGFVVTACLPAIVVRLQFAWHSGLSRPHPSHNVLDENVIRIEGACTLPDQQEVISVLGSPSRTRLMS